MIDEELRKKLPNCPPCPYDNKYNPDNWDCYNCGYIGVEMSFDEELMKNILELNKNSIFVKPSE